MYTLRHFNALLVAHCTFINFYLCNCQSPHVFAAHGDEWYEAYLPLDEYVGRLRINAYVGDGPLGNIAIDDFKLVTGPCPMPEIRWRGKTELYRV